MVKKWESVLIGDCFDFKNGLNKGKEYFGKGTPIINYTDVYKKRCILKSDIKGKVSLSSDEIKRFRVEKNDVFFTRTSETPEEVGYASVLLEDIENCVFSGFVLRAHPKNDKFFPLYCKYCFMTPDIREAITKSCTYTTRALTNGRQLSAIEVNLPSRPEQQRIAEALSDMDELIASLVKLIEKKKAIKQGAMQELLTGKRRLLGFGGEWRQVPIKTIGSIVTGSTPSRSNPEFWGGKYAWVSARDFSSKYVNATVETVTDLGKKECRFVPKGSVLVTCIASIGLNAIAACECATNQQINSITCNTEYDNEFIYYQICTQIDVMKSIAGQTAVPIISKTQFENLRLLVPPTTEEQHFIGKIFADMDDELFSLNGRLNKASQIRQGMMDQLLIGKIRLA